MDLQENFTADFQRLQRTLSTYSRARYSIFGSLVEDLVATTIADLWEYVHNNPRTAFSSEDLDRIAFTLLRRRAVDLFRDPATKSMLALEKVEESDEVVDEHSEKRLLMKDVLQITMREIQKLSREERNLLAIASGLSATQHEAMSQRDRQRLHRLRSRLATAIRSSLGEDVANLIREDA